MMTGELQIKVAQAVHVLNHDSLSCNRVAANQWLVQFQHSDAALEVSTFWVDLGSSVLIDLGVDHQIGLNWERSAHMNRRKAASELHLTVGYTLNQRVHADKVRKFAVRFSASATAEGFMNSAKGITLEEHNLSKESFHHEDQYKNPNFNKCEETKVGCCASCSISFGNSSSPAQDEITPLTGSPYFSFIVRKYQVEDPFQVSSRI